MKRFLKKQLCKQKIDSPVCLNASIEANLSRE